MNKYKQYEYCKAVGCLGLNGSECTSNGCFKTAKDFHTWLDKNGYDIRKKEETMTKTEFLERKLQVMLQARALIIEDIDIDIDRLDEKLITEKQLHQIKMMASSQKHTEEEKVKVKILNLIRNAGFVSMMSIADWKELVEDLVANGVTIDE